MNRFAALFAVTAVGLVGFTFAQNTPPKPAAPVPAKSAAVDLGNTVCPVSGDKVGDSKLTEVYEGKIYHFCCDDCPNAFKKDPAKYAKIVAADPDKYGVKK